LAVKRNLKSFTVIIVLKFKADGPNPAFATLLGKIRDDGSVKLPAVLHIPGQGTMRITAVSATKEPLYFGYSGTNKGLNRQNYVKLSHKGWTKE